MGIYRLGGSGSCAEHLLGGCGIRDPRPGGRAACSVGPDLTFAPQLLQGEPDRLVADAWHRRPDVSEAERGGRVTQYVLADALLLGPRGPGGCGAVGEDSVGAGDHAGEVAEPGPRVGCPFVPAVGGVQERLVVGVG